MINVVNIRKMYLQKSGYTDFEDWARDPDHLYIGRDMTVYVPGTTKSKWANPYPVKTYGLEESLKLYEKHVRESYLYNDLEELEGKTLGCWCKPNDCHGDILIKLLEEKKRPKIEKKEEAPFKNKMSTITITFGEVAENHVRNQKLGTMASKGFSYKNIAKAKNIFEEKGFVTELTELKYENEKAWVMIIRDGISAFVDKEDLLSEQNSLTPDTKVKMYGRVVNKKARHNLCFDDQKQEPSYEEGKGRVVSWDDVPLTKKIREELPLYFGKKARNLKAEGNYYYDTKNCGIGFHGDAERKRVIALRLGDTMPLHYQWFYKSKPVGDRVILTLNHGDMYIMSEKATGFDWKLKNTPTLRHAAGAEKFLKIK